MRVSNRALLTAIACGVGVSAHAQLTGYEPLTDWEALSWSKAGLGSELFSSYDPAGNNLDYNQYVSPTGYQTDVAGGKVAASYTGPGVVRRFWMPHRTSNLGYDLKVTMDGAVIFDTNTDDYLGGNVGFVNNDFTRTLIGGQTSYEPLVFQDSLLIETSNNGDGANTGTRNYYQTTSTP